MKKYLLLALLTLLGCSSPDREKEDVSGILLSDVLPLDRIAALVPAKSVKSDTPDLILGGNHYGVKCRLEEGKRIKGESLEDIFNDPEQHFEQYNPWIGGEEKILVAVDNFGLPILAFISREGIPDVLKVRSVVATDQGKGWYPFAAFYCELNHENIVENLNSIYEQGSDFSASDIAKPIVPNQSP